MKRVILIYFTTLRGQCCHKEHGINMEEKSMNLRFDPMTQEYSKVVMDIFNYYVTHSFAAYPESPVPYEFFNRFFEMTKGYPAFVIKNNETGNVVGFCFLHAYHPFPVFRETAEITYFWIKT